MQRPEPAFRAVHDQHFKLVWSSLRRLGVREADVLDLSQKVFLTAFLKLPEFEGRSSIGGWLHGICQRVASDYRKSARIRREVPVDAIEMDELTMPNEDDATSSFDSRQRAHVADAILAKLPEAQRLAFVLYELEEMPARDIAALLGLSVGTVRSRLRLARRAFAREVDKSPLSRDLAAGSQRDPPRLLSPRGQSSLIAREVLGLVRHVGPPREAQERAWRSIAQSFGSRVASGS